MAAQRGATQGSCAPCRGAGAAAQGQENQAAAAFAQGGGCGERVGDEWGNGVATVARGPCWGLEGVGWGAHGVGYGVCLSVCRCLQSRGARALWWGGGGFHSAGVSLGLQGQRLRAGAHILPVCKHGIKGPRRLGAGHRTAQLSACTWGLVHVGRSGRGMISHLCDFADALTCEGAKPGFRVGVSWATLGNLLVPTTYCE